MKLTGDLEKQVNSTKDWDEARQLIENAGMLLDDEELNSVAGGNVFFILMFILKIFTMLFVAQNVPVPTMFPEKNAVFAIPTLPYMIFMFRLMRTIHHLPIPATVTRAGAAYCNLISLPSCKSLCFPVY